MAYREMPADDRMAVFVPNGPLVQVGVILPVDLVGTGPRVCPASGRTRGCRPYQETNEVFQPVCTSGLSTKKL